MTKQASSAGDPKENVVEGSPQVGDMLHSLHIRPRTPEDDARIVEVYRAIAPERPPMTVEEMRHDDAMEPEEAHHQRWVAEVEGRILGVASWSKQLYTEGTDTWGCEIAVDPHYWGQGAGSTLYDHLLADVAEQGGRRLKCSIREDQPQGRAFAEHRGFQPTGHGQRMSRLDVRTANLEKCRAADARMQELGVRIATLSELGENDEELLYAIYRLDDETTRDVPMSDAWTTMPFEYWRKYLQAPGLSPETFWLAMVEDRPVGMAVLERKGERAATNAYTGVDRSHRAKGIARALKLRTVEWARENGVDTIYTGNSVHNKPMLAINIDMGYEALPAEITMVKEL